MDYGQNLLEQRDGTGAMQAHYTDSPGTWGNLVSERRGDDTTYYAFDGSDNTRETVDSSGAVNATVTYLPFGEQIGSDNDGTYVSVAGRMGYQQDDERLRYVRARYLDVVTGRWLSRDPLGFGGGDVNLYRNVGNDPVNHSDPSGMDAYQVASDLLTGMGDNFSFGITKLIRHYLLGSEYESVVHKDSLAYKVGDLIATVLGLLSAKTEIVEGFDAAKAAWASRKIAAAALLQGAAGATNVIGDIAIALRDPLERLISTREALAFARHEASHAAAHSRWAPLLVREIEGTAIQFFYYASNTVRYYQESRAEYAATRDLLTALKFPAEQGYILEGALIRYEEMARELLKLNPNSANNLAHIMTMGVALGQDAMAIRGIAGLPRRQNSNYPATELITPPSVNAPPLQPSAAPRVVARGARTVAMPVAPKPRHRSIVRKPARPHRSPAVRTRIKPGIPQPPHPNINPALGFGDRKELNRQWKWAIEHNRPVPDWVYYAGGHWWHSDARRRAYEKRVHPFGL